MPRQGKLTIEQIFEILKEFPLFNEYGELKKQSDPVWLEVIKRMPEITIKNVYHCVLQDRQKIKTNLMRHMNVKHVRRARMPGEKRKAKRNWEYFSKISRKQEDFSYYESLDKFEEENKEKFDPSLREFNKLISLKESPYFKDKIHELCFYPFSVAYWDNQQIDLCHNLSSESSVVSFIVLDHLVTCKDLPNGTDTIFLYALAVRIENSVYLLAQMMSEVIESSFLSENFLNLWLEQKAVVPQEIVVGYSYSLLNGVSLAFNTCNFNKYNLWCYQYLINEAPNLPYTLIQIDIICLIRVIDEWASFNNVAQEVKDFYLCSVMYLSTLTNLDIFKDTIVSVLAICQSPYKGEEMELRRSLLWDNLTSDMIQELNQRFINYVAGENGSRTYFFLNRPKSTEIRETTIELYDFVDQLKMQSIELCDFTDTGSKATNPYYCPLILEDLVGLFTEFPSWTRIVFQKDNVADLASYCSDKHLTYLNECKTPKQASGFLKYHLEKISSLLLESGLVASTSAGANGWEVDESDSNYISSNLHASKYNPDVEYTSSNDGHHPFSQGHSSKIKESELTEFKKALQKAACSLIDLDRCVDIIFEKKSVEAETKIAKAFVDCCVEIPVYDKFFGTVAERICSKSLVFASTFEQIFNDCYNTVDAFEKKDIKNICKLFAHLFMSNCISWTTLSILKLKKDDITPSKTEFIKVILREFAKHMNISELHKRVKKEAHNQTFKGLLPIDGTPDAQFAADFYDNIGLKSLWHVFKDSIKMNGESSKLRRSSSNSSLSGEESYTIQVRVPKKRKKFDVKKEENMM